MTQRPLQTVNAGLSLIDDALPTVPGLNLALSLERVQALHGTAAGSRYRHFLGRALEAQPGRGQGELLTLAALAAWRAGALAFRTDALRRLDLALTDGAVRPPALAAALGLPEYSVAPFAELQRATRFGWPEIAAGDLVAVVGGFRGLFGPWLAPPVAVLAGDRPGTYLIRTAPTRPDGATGTGADSTADSADDWVLSIDVFGHTLTRLAGDEAGEDHPFTARWASAGSTIAGPDEAGAPGAVLQLAGYTASLRLPKDAA